MQNHMAKVDVAVGDVESEETRLCSIACIDWGGAATNTMPSQSLIDPGRLFY